MALAARRARNLDDGFQVIADPQVAEASRRMGIRILLYSLVVGFLYGGLAAAIPLG